jgi:hypothetical protein
MGHDRATKVLGTRWRWGWPCRGSGSSPAWTWCRVRGCVSCACPCVCSLDCLACLAPSTQHSPTHPNPNRSGRRPSAFTTTSCGSVATEVRRPEKWSGSCWRMRSGFRHGDARWAPLSSPGGWHAKSWARPSRRCAMSWCCLIAGGGVGAQAYVIRNAHALLLHTQPPQFLGSVMGAVGGSGGASSSEGENGYAAAGTNGGQDDDGTIPPPPRTLFDALLEPKVGRPGVS